MSASYEISEEPMDDGEVRLTWTKDGKPHYPLNFWIVPPDRVADAKVVIAKGELDTDITDRPPSQ